MIAGIPENLLLSILSPRALRMISGGVWHEELRERAEMAKILRSYGIEATEALLGFQEGLGGLEYQIRGRPEGWRFGLISNEVDYLIESQFATALEHRTEQLAFALHYLSGEIFVKDYTWIPIASSAKMVVESDAMIDEIVDVWGAGVFVVLRHDAKGDLPLDHGLLQVDPELAKVNEASDQYTTWWANDRLRIIRRVLYPGREAGDWVALYARDVMDARRFVAALIMRGVFKKVTEISCFPHPFVPVPIYQGVP